MLIIQDSVLEFRCVTYVQKKDNTAGTEMVGRYFPIEAMITSC